MRDIEESHVVVVESGEYVYRQGETADAVFVVEKGTVVLTSGSGTGEKARERLGPGSVFGESALGGGASREANAVADGEAILLRIARPAFLQLVGAFPPIAAGFVARLSDRLNRGPVPQGRTTREPAAPIEMGVERPRLVHASGAEFALPIEGEALVGRADPQTGFTPHVELSDLDAQRSLSRKHARLFCERSGFHVQEEASVRNGTFVNGRRLKPCNRVPIADGDEIAFGRIKMTLRLR